MAAGRGAGLTAWIALLAVCSGLAMPLMASRHLARDVDPKCSPPVWLASGLLVIEPAESAPRSEHCALCHWWRHVGNTALPSPPPAVAILSPSADHPPFAHVPWAAGSASLPASRAPPIL